MRFMTIATLTFALSAGASFGATDDEKEAECQFQADLISAVTQARLDRVRKANVAETVLEANPDWPTGTENALPPLVEYIYGIKRRDLKDQDLAGVTKAQCIENYDQIQELKNSVTN